MQALLRGPRMDTPKIKLQTGNREVFISNLGLGANTLNKALRGFLNAA
jgi:hypothetical protein